MYPKGWTMGLLSKGRETYKAGAVKLMAAGIIVKLLGFVNRILLSNLIGAEGMGLFQLTSPVYSLIILTLTSGVSVTVSAMTASEAALGKMKNASRIAKVSFLLLFAAGTLAGLAMAFFAKPIAVNILNDERTYLSLIMLAPCIPVVASAAAVKGYFYGTRNVGPNAAGQITEQIGRITVIFALASFIAGEDLAKACAIATVSSAIGETADLLVVGTIFLYKDRKNKHQQGIVTSFRQIGKQVVRSSVPISASRFLTSLMGTVESVILPMRFTASGLSYKASVELLGNLSGMAMPIISFPSVLTSALATTLVPAISEARASGKNQLATDRILKCIRLSFFMGFFFFGVFYSFGELAGNIFYPGQEAGTYIAMLAPCCILFYFQQTMHGILNGLQKEKESLVATVITYVIRIGSIWFLLPVLGVYGYIIGILAGMLTWTVFTMVVVCKETGMKPQPFQWIILPAIPGLLIAILRALVV